MKIQTYLVPDVSDNNDGLLHSFCFRTFDGRNFWAHRPKRLGL